MDSSVDSDILNSCSCVFQKQRNTLKYFCNIKKASGFCKESSIEIWTLTAMRHMLSVILRGFL